jgi:cardiolipin synthase A/B
MMSFFRVLRIAVPLVAVSFLTACSSGNFQSQPAARGTISGTAYGGQQPIANATIQLYAAGTGGDGTAATALLTSAVTTDANGNFSFSGPYSCSGATPVYLTATGGQPSPAVTNANITLMSALGTCSSLSTISFVQINEDTTVGAVAALAPYMTSATSVGSGSSDASSLASAMSLATEFINFTTGQAPGTNVPSGYSVPITLINTLGNILASCVNSSGGVAGDGSACGKLFSLATPISGPAPTNTATALLDILNNPTSNLSSLTNLNTTTAPFQPSLSSAPSSFAVQLQTTAPAITRTLYAFPESDNSVTPLYALVNNAQKTIDMTMYELVDTTFSADLIAACQRGVKVRVILDQSLEKSSNTPAYNQLNAQTNCSAAWSNPAFQATHQKTIILDGTTVAIMSLNLTSRYYSTTRDFALIENDPVDIAAIQTTFNTDYGSTTDYSYVPNNGDDLIWSPTNAQSALLGVINGATSTLLVENEEMSAASIVSALEAACQRGVSVHIAMTDTGSYHSNYTALQAAGCGVHTYVDNSTTLYIHAKAIVADYGTSAQTAYMGSINFSNASMTENRELGLYISDPTVLQQLYTTITSDYAGAPAY